MNIFLGGELYINVQFFFERSYVKESVREAPGEKPETIRLTGFKKRLGCETSNRKHSLLRALSPRMVSLL